CRVDAVVRGGAGDHQRLDPVSPKPLFEVRADEGGVDALDDDRLARALAHLLDRLIAGKLRTQERILLGGGMPDVNDRNASRAKGVEEAPHVGKGGSVVAPFAARLALLHTRLDVDEDERRLSRIEGHRPQTLSMMVAVPMPAPMQSVTSAVLRSRRSSSSSTVPKIMAPVAPNGWP